MFLAGMPQWTALAFFLALMAVPILALGSAVVARKLGARAETVRKVIGVLFGVVGAGVMLAPARAHPGGVFLGFLAFLALTAVASFASSQVRRVASAFAGSVAFDEGGVRLRRFGRASYVPFDRIADAKIRTSVFDRPYLVIEEARGGARVAPLAASPTETLGAILSRMHPFEMPDAAAALARGGRTLASWREAVHAYVSGGSVAYRDGGLTTDQLVAFVRDSAVDPEARAGAAFALAVSGSEEGRAACREVLRASPPPIMVAMLADLAPADVLRDATPFLSKEDRQALSAIRSPAPPRLRLADAEEEPRVRVGEEVAATETEPPPSVPSARKGRAA